MFVDWDNTFRQDKILFLPLIQQIAKKVPGISVEKPFSTARHLTIISVKLPYFIIKHPDNSIFLPGSPFLSGIPRIFLSGNSYILLSGKFYVKLNGKKTVPNCDEAA